LKAKFLELEAEGVLLVFQINTGRGRQELLSCQSYLRRIRRLRGWQLG